MKVSIKNFQAIKDVSLEFKQGITAIVGNSNNGKSSIIRAIEAAINNKGGSSFINYEADSCSVTINDLGHEITWNKHKKQGKSSYIIDGKELKKIGQSQLDEVGQLIKMTEIVVNNEKIRLNFWKQMDFPFLVGKTPYQLFDFISMSKEQDIVTSFQNDKTTELKDITKELSEINAKVDLRSADISSAEEELKSLEKYNSVEVEKLELMLNFLETIDDLIIKKAAIELSYNEKIHEFGQVKAKIDKLRPLLVELEENIKTAKNYNDLIENYKANNNIINALNDKKAKINAHTCRDKINKLTPIINKQAELCKFSEALEEQFVKLSHTASSIDVLKAKFNEIMSSQKATKTALSKFDTCPMCGHSLKENHMEENHE